MKTLLTILLLIPYLSLADIVKNVETLDCEYYKFRDQVSLRVYNNNNRDIKSITIELMDKDGKKYKFKKEYNKSIIVKAYSSELLYFHNIFIEPKICKLIKVNFKGLF